MVELPTCPTPSATATGEPTGGVADPEAMISRRIERLPVEIGVLLMAAGVTTGILPPPPGPFDLTIIASGGLILWPRGFRAIDGWTKRRFPGPHRAAMGFLGRFSTTWSGAIPNPWDAIHHSTRRPRPIGDGVWGYPMYHRNEWQSGAEECFWPHDPILQNIDNDREPGGPLPADLPPQFRSRGAATRLPFFQTRAQPLPPVEDLRHVYRSGATARDSEGIEEGEQ